MQIHHGGAESCRCTPAIHSQTTLKQKENCQGICRTMTMFLIMGSILHHGVKRVANVRLRDMLANDSHEAIG